MSNNGFNGMSATDLEPKIVCNRIRTPDGTVIYSRHRHDYVCHVDDNGFEYVVDGGLDYLKRARSDRAPSAVEMSVYSTDPHEVIREAFAWGSRGIKGDQPVMYLTLMNMQTEHIEAILDTQRHITPVIRKVFEDELKYRKQNG
jgi:hypothetical protein